MDLDVFLSTLLDGLDLSHTVIRNQNDEILVLAYSDPRPIVEILKKKHFSELVRMLAIRTKSEVSHSRYGRFIKIIKNKFGYQVVRSFNVLVAEDLSNIDLIFYENF